MPVVVLLLLLPVSLPLWNALPKLRFLQFPWRWLVALEAPAGIFFASAVWVAGRCPRRVVMTACTTLFLASSAAAGVLFFQPCDDEDAVAPMLSAYRAGNGFAGTDEYAPPGADNTEIATGLPMACLVEDPTATLGEPADRPDANPNWLAGQHRCEATFAASPDAGKATAEHLRIAAVASHSGYLIVRLRSYPAWRVAVNGKAVGPLPVRDDGLIAVPVAQGPVDLTVDWTTTADVKTGRWLSGISLALVKPCGCHGKSGFGLVYDEKDAHRCEIAATGRRGADGPSAGDAYSSVETVPASIHGAMRHSVFAGGKRLRPVLSMQAAVAIAGTLPKRIERLGAALEMLHTYSLIHDDLPALDNDDLRRGKPTCHVAFGEAIAILAGDALQTRAFEVLAGLDAPPLLSSRSLRW